LFILASGCIFGSNAASERTNARWADMIDKELLEILACPETKEPVRLADRELIDRLNARIARGELKNRGGKIVKGPLDGGLVRQDGAYLYPIEDDIPIMLIDEAIPLNQ
jgi:uncharacterized protein